MRYSKAAAPCFFSNKTSHMKRAGQGNLQVREFSKHLFLGLLSVVLFGCESTPTAPRTINLQGQTFSTASLGDIETWSCRDFLDMGRVLVEIGRFTTNPTSPAEFGFVQFAGWDSGEATTYTRDGLGHRWDWETDGNGYSFLLQPGGTGSYYDFTDVNSRRSLKAKHVYSCN